jgi:hypothetical protein
VQDEPPLARAGAGGQSRYRLMATTRNLVIGLIRQSGYTKIAATIPKIKHDQHRYSHHGLACPPKRHLTSTNDFALRPVDQGVPTRGWTFERSPST